MTLSHACRTPPHQSERVLGAGRHPRDSRVRRAVVDAWLVRGSQCSVTEKPEIPLTTILRVLKDRTAGTHRLVEDQLALLHPEISVARITTVVQQLYGFWAGTEAEIDDWSHHDSVGATAIEWPRRRRVSVLSQDLVSLGLPISQQLSLPIADPVFATVGRAEVLGWLYVAEGSTLGGAIIDRHLRNRPALGLPVLRSFTPYAEGPGPMWRSYCAAAESWCHERPDRSAAVAAASVATFTALHQWLLPLSVRAST
jgi:heme oxygenase